jgi:putative aldouronate transport system permease protein
MTAPVTRSAPARNRIKAPPSLVAFNVICYTLLSLGMLICAAPFWLLVSGSFTSERSIAMQGYNFIPGEFSLDAYRVLMKDPQTILRAYGVSITVTAVGAVLGLLVVTMTAYALSRKDFRYRYRLTFFFYFTTLFSGGLISIYVLFVRYLNLKNSMLSLILPPMMNVFYLLIMRSFIAAIPDTICESAKIDGAGHFRILFQLVIPLSTSALATIGLFFILDYWNDWYHAMLYISDYKKYPLQYMLYNLLSASEAYSRISRASSVAMVDMPSRSLKLSMTVIATGPVLLAYPFVQKYFVKGVTLGAVKG